MSLKIRMEVRSLKSARVSMVPEGLAETSTSLLVSAIPKKIKVLAGTVKGVPLDRDIADFRDLNRARQGLKDLEPELTSSKVAGDTR